jgi:large subunit ribosomal protein L29
MKENADKARGLDSAELAKQLRDSAEQVFRLRFQMSMGQMEGVKKLRSLKKERARILTVLRERELDREPAHKPATASTSATQAKTAVKAAKPKPAAAGKIVAPKTKREAAPKPAAKPKVTLRARKSSKV